MYTEYICICTCVYVCIRAHLKPPAMVRTHWCHCKNHVNATAGERQCCSPTVLGKRVPSTPSLGVLPRSASKVSAKGFLCSWRHPIWSMYQSWAADATQNINKHAEMHCWWSWYTGMSIRLPLVRVRVSTCRCTRKCVICAMAVPRCPGSQVCRCPNMM